MVYRATVVLDSQNDSALRTGHALRARHSFNGAVEPHGSPKGKEVDQSPLGI